VAGTAQAPIVHLDTHVVCWLYEGRIDLLSVAARDALERAQALAVSPIVDLELQLLHEIGRLLEGPATVLPGLARDMGLRLAESPFGSVVAAAREVEWTRDPFDRLIVASAVMAQAKLITKDSLIRKNCRLALW
jgi:PIN domain nuclease of toxin-antitoxin system